MTFLNLAYGELWFMLLLYFLALFVGALWYVSPGRFGSTDEEDTQRHSKT